MKRVTIEGSRAKSTLWILFRC